MHAQAIMQLDLGAKHQGSWDIIRQHLVHNGQSAHGLSQGEALALTSEAAALSNASTCTYVFQH